MFDNTLWRLKSDVKPLIELEQIHILLIKYLTTYLLLFFLGIKYIFLTYLSVKIKFSWSTPFLRKQLWGAWSTNTSFKISAWHVVGFAQKVL